MRKIRLVSVFAVASLILFGATSAWATPSGNNGTVKVDNIDLDHRMNANEPHVGCLFQIEWYGFDAGASSRVTFKTHPPTSNRPLLTDVMRLDGDDNSGGGSPAGFDGSRLYQLSFNTGDYYQPNQGYHVYLTINTTTSKGSDVKHKVFWVTGCYPDYPEYPGYPG